MNDDIHADQNLRLARKMLDQQGEISRLTAECAALAVALGNPAVTHEFVTPGPLEDMCGKMVPVAAVPPFVPCCHSADHPVHRAPAVVRAELEGP